MFKGFRRIFSLTKIQKPLIRLATVSLTMYFLETQIRRQFVSMTDDENLKSIHDETSFKVTQYSDTFYQLRKDLDDFIIITNLSQMNQHIKKRILSILENIYNNSSKNGRRLRVMFVPPQDHETEKKLEDKNNLKITNKVIFLIKNKYSEKLQPFTVNELEENREGLSMYFQPIVPSQRDDVLKVIEKLDDNQAVVLYVGQDFNSATLYQSQKKYKLAERAVFNEKKNVKFLFVDKQEQLKALGIADTITDHYHLILKNSNQSTIQPNLSFNNINYHILSNIQLYDEGKLSIDQYIDAVHTFSENFKRFNLVLSVDKNNIDLDQQQEIITALRDVKKQNQYQDLSYQINFNEVASSQSWTIEISDLVKLDESISKYTHGIQSPEDLPEVGKHTFRYKLESIPTKQNIQSFINSVRSGQAHEYFLSEEPKVVNSLHKLTGKSFNKHVLDNDKHHLVFQFSEHCQACKELAPILVKFHTENSNHRIETHRLSEDNVVKGQIIYPYSPVLLFFKQGWKPNAILIPTQVITKESKNIKAYCQILADIETVDEEELQKHYFQAANLSWENLPFKLL